MNKQKIFGALVVAAALAATLTGCTSAGPRNSSPTPTTSSASPEVTTAPSPTATFTPTVKASPSASPAVTATSSPGADSHISEVALDREASKTWPAYLDNNKVRVHEYPKQVLEVLRELAEADKYGVRPMPQYGQLDVGSHVNCSGSATLMGSKAAPVVAVWCDKLGIFLTNGPAIENLPNDEARVQRDLILSFARAQQAQNGAMPTNEGMACIAGKLIRSIYTKGLLIGEKLTLLLVSFTQTSWDTKSAAAWGKGMLGAC